MADHTYHPFGSDNWDLQLSVCRNPSGGSKMKRCCWRWRKRWITTWSHTQLSWNRSWIRRSISSLSSEVGRVKPRRDYLGTRTTSLMATLPFCLSLNRQGEVIPLCAPGGGASQQADQPQEGTRSLGAEGWSGTHSNEVDVRHNNTEREKILSEITPEFAFPFPLTDLLTVSLENLGNRCLFRFFPQMGFFFLNYFLLKTFFLFHFFNITWRIFVFW